MKIEILTINNASRKRQFRTAEAGLIRKGLGEFDPFSRNMFAFSDDFAKRDRRDAPSDKCHHRIAIPSAKSFDGACTHA